MATGGRPVGLAEPIEDVREESGVDPDPRVDHADLDMRVDPLQDHLDLAPLGVNLTAFVTRFQTTCWSRATSPVIGPDHRVEGLDEADLLRLAAGGDSADRRVDHLDDVDPLDVEPEVTRNDPGHVEEVFDQPRLDLAVPLDGVKPLDHVLGVDPTALEDLGPAERWR